MIQVMIGVLVGVALWLVKSLVASGPEKASHEAGVSPAWHSDYKQLRVEYHQPVDESLSPPKH
jgi:hypothetical protein